MTDSIQSDTAPANDFGNAADPYGDIGYEAALPHPHTIYITAGRYGKVDLPPNSVSKAVKITAPVIVTGKPYDIV